MKVSKMIEFLRGCNPEAEVKLHCITGHNALFVCQTTTAEGTKVFIEDETDSDLRNELVERFDTAVDCFDNELEFFLDLLDTGFTLKNIEEYVPEKYEYSKQFLEEHGLI